MNKTKKIFFLIVKSILITAVCLLSSCSKITEQKVTKPPVNEKNEVKSEPEDTLYSVIGVGDIMMGTNYPSSASLPCRRRAPRRAP